MRHLPVIYSGQDAGPRPETRRQVHAALQRGVDPVVVLEHVAKGLSELWNACCAALAEGESRPACARGCSACCHQRVEVTAPEVFFLARWLTRQRSTEIVAIVRNVSRAATQLTGVSAHDHFLRQVPCVFISETGECSVYEARPLACRRAHSVDVDVCKSLAAEPHRDVRVPVSEGLSWNTSALVLGYYEGLFHAGLPTHHYELTAALAVALTSANAEARWREGEDVLAPAKTRSAEELTRILARDLAASGECRPSSPGLPGGTSRIKPRVSRRKR